jgi:hypothetical protein
MSKERDIVELLRSVMYSSAEEGNENFFEEVEDLGRMLGEYDCVAYSAKDNRLTQALVFIKENFPQDWVELQGLNNP